MPPAPTIPNTVAERIFVSSLYKEKLDQRGIT